MSISITASPLSKIVFSDSLSVENWLSSLNLQMYQDNFDEAGVTDLDQAFKMIAEGHISQVSSCLHSSVIFADIFTDFIFLLWYLRFHDEINKSKQSIDTELT